MPCRTRHGPPFKLLPGRNGRSQKADALIGGLSGWAPRVQTQHISGPGRWPGPLMPHADGTGGTDQPVVTAVSSTTNEVCSEESSVPVNFRVTVWPAKLPTGMVC